MKNIISRIKKINLKSIYFNFKYLPFKKAVRLPIFISNKVYLKKCKGIIEISEDSLLTGMIKIGYGEVGIFDNKNSRSIWQVEGTVIFRGRANIGHGSKISVDKDAILDIGDKFKITAESSIIANKEIRFGTGCLLSWDVLIMDTDYHKIKDKLGRIVNPSTPVIIGENVWIGCRCLILKGSKIADNSVIGANSFIKSDISKKTGVFAGNPIRLVKENVFWEL